MSNLFLFQKPWQCIGTMFVWYMWAWWRCWGEHRRAAH